MPLSIVGSARSSTSTSAAVTVTTSTTFLATLPGGGVQAGDLILANYTFATTASQTLAPANPTGFTTLLDYSPGLGWNTRTHWAWYDAASMSGGITFNMTGTASTTGGMQVNLVAIRGVDPITPIQSTTEGTSLPSGSTGSTTTNFATVTPTKPGCGVFWTLSGYLASVVADDASWNGVATELLDTLGPKCNASGSAAAFTAGYVQTAAAATGTITCTVTNSRQYRDGAVVIVNPQQLIVPTVLTRQAVWRSTNY